MNVHVTALARRCVSDPAHGRVLSQRVGTGGDKPSDGASGGAATGDAAAALAALTALMDGKSSSDLRAGLVFAASRGSAPHPASDAAVEEEVCVSLLTTLSLMWTPGVEEPATAKIPGTLFVMLFQKQRTCVALTHPAPLVPRVPASRMGCR